LSHARPDPRRLALGVLSEVHAEGAYANLALPKALGTSGLEERDRAFATELVYGTLRREGELDVIISLAANRAIDTIDQPALDVLRLGVYQILHLRVPDHAAVDQSVRLARAVGAHKATGFINAVLRTVVARGEASWDRVVADDARSVASHPAWIAEHIERALQQCGGSAELTAALEAHNESPLVTLACLPGLSEVSSIDTRTQWSPLGAVMGGGNPADDSRVASGVARVQDEGSQLAALLLTRARTLAPGDVLLDMCAGPGGKTAVLAAEALVAGASVHALEKVPHRVELVRDSTRAITALGGTVLQVRQGDARSLKGRYSHILLDAPCSGLGALRRRPEARWAKSADQIEDLATLQAELLESGLGALSPGGILAYVTCSPVVEETVSIVAGALEKNPDVEAMDTPAILDSIAVRPVPGASRGTAVQLWTHRHGTDAMFVQLLRRRDES
jgi:16S rRNA (cytosine967-C5)-methyltransferase